MKDHRLRPEDSVNKICPVDWMKGMKERRQDEPRISRSMEFSQADVGRCKERSRFRELWGSSHKFDIGL